MTLGQHLRKLRTDAGYANASAFAREVGVASNTIYRWERDEMTPDLVSLKAIAKATGRTLDEVATPSTPTPPHVAGTQGAPS